MALGKAKELVSSNPVNKFCPYCVCVKQLFVQYKAIELDQESDGSEIQSALAEWTGQQTLPNVFVGGNHIGDCDCSKVETPPAVSSLYFWKPCEPGTFDSTSLGRRGVADTGGSPGTLFEGPKGTNDTYRKYRCRFLGKCLICSLDEHASSVCPYQVEVPKNATVDSGCDVVCRVCDREFSGRCCNQDSGRAKLKYCDLCMQFGRHWTFQCPHKHEHTRVPVRFGPHGWLTSSEFKNAPNSIILMKKSVV